MILSVIKFFLQRFKFDFNNLHIFQIFPDTKELHQIVVLLFIHLNLIP